MYFIMNEAHFKGTAPDIREIHKVIENTSAGVGEVTTYTDRAGREHLVIEFETEGQPDHARYLKWQQVEMKISSWQGPDQEWLEWSPARQRAKKRWKL